MLNLRGGAIEMKSALVFSIGAIKRDRKEYLLVAESSFDLLEGFHLSSHDHSENRSISARSGVVASSVDSSRHRKRQRQEIGRNLREQHFG